MNDIEELKRLLQATVYIHPEGCRLEKGANYVRTLPRVIRSEDFAGTGPTHQAAAQAAAAAGGYVAHVEVPAQMMERLVAILEAAERDAARYRWICEAGADEIEGILSRNGQDSGMVIDRRIAGGFE